MTLLELGGGLESRCIIALRQDNELFKFLKSIKTKIPAYVYIEGDLAKLQLYFNTESIDAHDRTFLERSGARKIDDVYVVQQRVESKDELGIINKLITEPMVVSNAIYVSEGWLVADMRFHTSKYRNVSRILASYLHNTDRVRLLFLGKSPGLATILAGLNEEVPLSIVIFEASITDAKVPDSLLQKEFDLIETENNLLTGDIIRVILYSKEEDGSMNALSEDQVKNELLTEIRKRANSNMIIRYNMFLTRKGDSVRVLVIMPSNQLNSYLKTVFSVANEVDGSVVTVVTAAPFDFGVMDGFA